MRRGEPFDARIWDGRRDRPLVELAEDGKGKSMRATLVKGGGID
jgi:hypothetical protein